ncbi:MAG: NAD(P)H-binding protein, partial [Bacteroidetes bacterium]|nr:NAD(P)H-binding protein [Bacteroidota bacterium]
MNEQTRELHVVIGAGPLGLSVVNAAVEKGYRVRLVHRSGLAAVPSSVECVAADVTDSAGLIRAVHGAACIYQCASPPYHQWPQLFPSLQRNILSAARTINARVVIGENLYMYGDTKGEPMTERTPWAATTRKGSIRARMAEEALYEHRSGRMQVAIARGADFFGPGVLQSILGDRAIGAAVRGARASLIGDMDMPHSFTYI